MLNIKSVIIFCILASLSLASFAESENPEQKQNELQQVNKQIESVKKNLEKDDALEAETQLQLKIIEMDLSDIHRETAELSEKLANEENTLKKLNAAQAIYLDQLNKQIATLGKQTRIIYQLGKMQSLKTILNTDNFNNLGRYLYYYRRLGEQRLKLVKEVQQIIETLQNNMSSVSQHQALLEVLSEERATEESKQLSMQKERQDLLAKIQVNTASHQSKLNALTQNQEALLGLLQNLRSKENVQENAPFHDLQGKLKWPVSGPVELAVDDHQDFNTDLKGYLIKTKEGTPVHVIAKGKVVFANWMRGFGLLVVVNHGDGYMSLYARNQTLFAKVGDLVQSNDVIAASGNTGGFITSGLYFEIRQNGKPIDPHLWCKKA